MNDLYDGSMDSDRLKDHIRANAEEIVRLHSRVHSTFKKRDNGPEARAEWEGACAEFQKRYDDLAFPGGYTGPRGQNGARARISSGDVEAVEAALCFLEMRPYFFRSGYMFKSLLRWCSRAPLSPDQSARLEVIKAALGEWKRKNKNPKGMSLS